MTFRPKPTRPSADALASALAPAARPLPAATGAQEAATTLVAFRVTPTFARVIADAAKREGSTRRLVARALAAYGLDVPAVDVDPPPPGRAKGLS